jgi:hypothetical protein
MSITFSLILLIVGALGLGEAMRPSAVVLPTVDLPLGIVRIVGYPTHHPECPPSTLCGLEAGAPPQTFYVVWSIYEPPTPEQPYGRSARRVLVLPLNPR